MTRTLVVEAWCILFDKMKMTIIVGVVWMRDFERRRVRDGRRGWMICLNTS